MPEKPKPTFYSLKIIHIKGTHHFFHANVVGIASPRTGKQPGCIAWQLLSSPQQCYTPLRSRNGLLVLNLIHICSKHSESTLFLYFDHIFSNVEFHEPYGVVSNLNSFSGSTLMKQSYRTVQLLHLLTAAKWHPTFATGVEGLSQLIY